MPISTLVTTLVGAPQWTPGPFLLLLKAMLVLVAAFALTRTMHRASGRDALGPWPMPEPRPRPFP